MHAPSKKITSNSPTENATSTWTVSTWEMKMSQVDTWDIFSSNVARQWFWTPKVCPRLQCFSYETITLFKFSRKYHQLLRIQKGGKSKLMPIFITYCNKTVFMNSINMICVCVSARTHINFKTFPWLNIPRLVCKSVYKTLPHCLLTALPSSTLLYHTTQNLELLPYFMTFIPCSPLVEL